MRNRFGFLDGLGSSRSQKIAMPEDWRNLPRKSVFSNKCGVTDLRFGRSLALRKAKSKSYNLIKGSELKEVVLDLESGFEVRAETLSSYQVVLRFKYSREEDWRNLPGKSVFSNKSGVTDLRFGRSLALRKAKSKGYNLIKGSELKEVVLDLESGFEVRAEGVGDSEPVWVFRRPRGVLEVKKLQCPVLGKRIVEICPKISVLQQIRSYWDLRFGRSLALRKAKSKGYNLIKGSELKEVVLDLESGFEVRAEVAGDAEPVWVFRRPREF
ncbi:hypothetical protein NE237_014169 [Protea cynaroides]|uniref:Uncharacterized protein n=1 Tax=Protea cynaroides TaxID=273540 RepID=A0A9Q0JS05_9MAGN|nr:hypothetical protein NE237_014169 [Protea cynaroides]